MIYGLIIADVIMAIVFGLGFFRLPPQIPLFYSRPWGEEQLGDLWFILLLPALLHIFFFVNKWIADTFFPQNKFPHQLLRIFNWFLVVIFTGIFIKIVVLII